MATIRCKACGRAYNYDKNGTCPKCGAYNRPPRKEVVEADGTVRYVTTESKECYEEKECHESEARQGVSTYDYTSVETNGEGDFDAHGDTAQPRLHRRKAITAGDPEKCIAVLGIICAVISLALSLIGNLNDRRTEEIQSSWDDWGFSRENWDLIADIGEEIPTENGSVTVVACRQSGDALQIDLRYDSIDNLTLSCYYETLTDSGYPAVELSASDGDLYTYLAPLPDGVSAEDCAVVLDIPDPEVSNRYWVWADNPVYEIGDIFSYCNQRVYLSSFTQEGNEIQVEFRTEDETPYDSDAQLTVLSADGETYVVDWHGIQSNELFFEDGFKLRFDFTLRDKNDIPQSITLINSSGNQRQVTINLQ